MTKVVVVDGDVVKVKKKRRQYEQRTRKWIATRVKEEISSSQKAASSDNHGPRKRVMGQFLK